MLYKYTKCHLKYIDFLVFGFAKVVSFLLFLALNKSNYKEDEKYKEEEWEISVNKSICAFVQKSMQPEEEDPSEESLFILKRKRRKYLTNHFTWDT